MNTKIFKSIYDQVGQTIPNHLIQSLIKKTLLQMNLVTREEFDVQKQVLIKTRIKLEALEAEVEKLQNQLDA